MLVIRYDRCPTGKRAFSGKRLAKAETKLIRKRGYGVPRMRVYKCRCGAWHLTTKVPHDHDTPIIDRTEPNVERRD